MPFATLQIDGIPVRYRRQGSGDPVLLLHGWGASIESFTPVFDALAPTFDTVALDFPGHGKTGLPPRPWRVADFLDFTLKAMDALHLERPHVVAHSFGGRVTIRLAAAHPERAGKLLFTAAAGVAPRKTLTRSLKRAAASAARAMESMPVAGTLAASLKSKLRPHVASRDYLAAGALRETLALVVAEDQSPYLSAIRSKCLMVWGDQDQETPLYMGETMKQSIPGSELVVFPGAGHFPYLDQPHKFNMMALKFFRE